MGYDFETLSYVFNKTRGRCRYCKKQLSWYNYGNLGGRGTWEVDHSVPRSRGGTDYLSNLVAACTSCNRDKSDRMGRSYIRTMQPPSRKSTNKGVGDAIAAIAGFAFVLWFLKALADDKRDKRTW